MNDSTGRAANYHSYMVRLWRENDAEIWRATAQSTATARIYQFATIEALFAFLRATAGTPQTGQPDPDAPAGQ